MRILIVDDSSVMRKMIARALLGSEFETAVLSEASDGEDALAVAGDGEFDVYLVDWNMPGMNGLEFVRRVRGVEKRATILMVTTERGDHYLKRARAEGVDGYVGKPFSSVTLPAQIREAIDGSAWRRPPCDD